MAQRPIREHDAKRLLAAYLPDYLPAAMVCRWQAAQVTPSTQLETLTSTHPWLLERRLVVKPDVLAGKRGKHGLVLLDVAWPDAADWLASRRGTEAAIGGVRGELSHFIIEPYLETEAEYYLAFRTEEDCDALLFSSHGGVDIEASWDAVRTYRLPVWPRPNDLQQPDRLDELRRQLLGPVPEAHALGLARFAAALYALAVDLGFAFLEINPLTISDGQPVPLDAKARLDDAALFECGAKWGEIEWPTQFGRRASAAEERVAALDARTGASLKLVVLNPAGTIWTMVAGGGASVIYTDTIADLGFAAELANYGEYSGNPSPADTYEYAREVFRLLTATPAPAGRRKHLFIGGGIANFTDVAETFAGIIRALREFAPALRATPTSIYVRRGGPNYAEGLRQIETAGRELAVPIQVYGPETHMTRIVSLALSCEAGEVSV